MKTIRGKVLHRIHDGSISLSNLINILDNRKKEIAYKAFRQVLLKFYL